MGGLRKDTTQGEVGCVCFNGDGELELVVLEDGSGGEGLLELPECSICCWRLGKPDPLASERSERSSERGVV